MTGILAGQADRVTVVEIDPRLAVQLRTRMTGSNVVARRPHGFRSGGRTISAAVRFTMLCKGCRRARFVVLLPPT